jgi:hypothetical protein
VSLKTASKLVKEHHYSRGGSRLRVYAHGLFLRGYEQEEFCLGVCWWIPPTKTAAQKTFPPNWMGVLSLSRMVILPGVPTNACSFLLSKSIKMIDRNKYPALVTYADDWRGHDGTVYKASNWVFAGKTKPERCYTLDGRMLSRKCGPKTRTHKEMIDLGCEMVGCFSKSKFVNISPQKAKRGIDETGTTPRS